MLSHGRARADDQSIQVEAAYVENSTALVTRREMEMARLLAFGVSNKQIAKGSVSSASQCATTSNHAREGMRITEHSCIAWTWTTYTLLW